MKRLALVSLLALLVGALTACGPTAPYAAKVDDHVISTDTIDQELHAITSNPQYAAQINEGLGGASDGTLSGLRPGGANTVSADYVSQLVYNRIIVQLIEQDLKSKDLGVTDAQRAEAEQTLREENNDPSMFNSLAGNVRSYYIEREADIAALVASIDTPAAEQRYYDTHQDEFMKICVRHILVKDQQTAAALRSQIAAGADFAGVAKANSLDNEGENSSAANGGDLGCFSVSEAQSLIAEFRDALLALQPGEVSQPVQTDFGFHLIQVTSKTLQTFGEAQPSIKQTIANPSDIVADLLAKAKIEVNPRYGEFKPADPTTGASAQLTPKGSTGLPESAPHRGTSADSAVNPSSVLSGS